MQDIALPQPILAETADLARIKIGAVGRLPAPAPTDVTDTGRIKVGAVGRLPADRTAA